MNFTHSTFEDISEQSNPIAIASVEPRVGLIAFASNNGLSVQTHDLYRHLKPAKTLLLDISELNHRDTHPERYLVNPEGTVITCVGIPTTYQYEKFLHELDILIICETPLNWGIITRAHQLGVRTVLQYNWEFLDHFSSPGLPLPTAFWSVSSWHEDQMRDLCREWGCLLDRLPTPVDRNEFKYKLRTEANTFLHIGGWETHEDRNGTETILEAIPLVKNKDVKFLIYSQHDIPRIKDPRVKIVTEDILSNKDLYKEGDVLLLPRKYGGQSLQLNEALSCGMIPIMTNVPPQDEYLMSDRTLVKAQLISEYAGKAPFEIYECSAQDLADKIDDISTAPQEDVAMWSEESGLVAESISWRRMLPMYKEAMKRVLER